MSEEIGVDEPTRLSLDERNPDAGEYSVAKDGTNGGIQ
jgi:hypothetical protein